MRHQRTLPLAGIMCLALLLAGALPCAAVATSPDIIVKISRIEKTLDLIDDLAGTGAPGTETAPTGRIRAMLQGTDWIDANRPIVLGLNVSDAQQAAALLVPYARPSSQFQTMFGARNGPGYYVLSLPPGTAQPVSGSMEAALRNAAEALPPAGIHAEMAVGSLIKTNRGLIDNWIAALEDDRADRLPTDASAPSPAEIRATADRLMDLFGQVETAAVALDLTADHLSLRCSTQADAASDLARLFTRPPAARRLGALSAGHQINFRSGAYDLAGFMELVETVMGPIYREMGIDFSQMAAMGKWFTGEAAGGLSYSETGVDFETILVLKDTTATDDFPEKVYLPLLEKYSRDMAALQERQSGLKIENMFTRTADSRVAGCKVIGVRSKVPAYFPLPHAGGPPPVFDHPDLAYDTRMTTRGGLLFMAANDKALEKLIRMSETFRPTDAKAPLASADIDLGAYFALIGKMLPDLPENSAPLRGPGRLLFEMDLKNGRAETLATFRTDALKAMIDQFNNIRATPPAGNRTGLSVQPASDLKISESRPMPRVKPSTDTTPDNWAEKGELMAAYGNDKAAVAFFQKAIQQDPGNSHHHFNLGVSYTELGQYDKALAEINAALATDNDNGAYYYARGRIHLLTGDREKAVPDFVRAARLDNRDAQDYLENIARIDWE